MYIEETCVKNIFRFANSLALIFGRLHKMIKVIIIHMEDQNISEISQEMLLKHVTNAYGQ